MVSFESDYINGAHPKVLEAIIQSNNEVLSGYGNDRYCESAKEKIKKACDCPNAQVEFLVGGTQTNAIIISTMLKDYEGVIAAQTGHVAMHEAGAIEYTGKKVITLPQKEGKILATDLAQYIQDFYADGAHEHMVFPGMVYISHPTEYGTLYSKKELSDLSTICRKNKITLFLDGARLGYGLASKRTDVTLTDIANLCDVFYIGGTKVGALCGEAVVFTQNNRPIHFVNQIKKRGALLAKGRLLGVQFDALFTNRLYEEIGEYAIEKAEEVVKIVNEAGIPFFMDSPTNQQFIILENQQLERIQKEVKMSFWEKYDENHTVLRVATSWSTTSEDIEKLKEVLRKEKA